MKGRIAAWSVLRTIAILMFLVCVHEWIVNGSATGLGIVIDPVYAQNQSVADKAYIAFEAGRYDETVRLAREVLSSSSDPTELINAEELLLLGVQWTLGYKAALTEAEHLKAQVQQQRPESPKELMFLEKLISDLKDAEATYQEAVAEQQKIIQKHPRTAQSAQAALWIARYSLFGSGRERGIEAFRRVIKEHPKTREDFTSRRTLAGLYEVCRDTDTAKQIWINAARDLVDSDYCEKAVRCLESLYVREKAYDQGIQALQNLKESSKSARLKSVSALSMGNLHRVQENMDAALAAYREATGYDGKSKSAVQAVENIKEICLQAKDHGSISAKGIQVLRDVAHLNRKSRLGSAAALAVGDLLQTQRNPGAALAAYNESIKCDCNSEFGVQAMVAIKDMYLKNKQPKEVLQQLARIIKLYPGSEAAARALLGTGEFYLVQQNNDLAEKTLLLVLTQYPKSMSANGAKMALAELYLAEGTTYSQKNDYASAVIAWKRSANYDTNEERRVGTLYLIACNLLIERKYDEVHTYIGLLRKSSNLAAAMYTDMVNYLEALTYYAAKDYESALPALRKVVSTSSLLGQQAQAAKLIKTIEEIEQLEKERRQTDKAEDDQAADSEGAM